MNMEETKVSTWGNEFPYATMQTYISGNELVPITTGPQAKDAAITKFYRHPDMGLGAYDNWTVATSKYYAQFKIQVKVNDEDGASTPLENDVYITNLLIQDAESNGQGSDLSDALRVHFAVTDADDNNTYLLFSKGVTETLVGGKLDLNNDGYYDKSFESFGTEDCIYGTAGAKQYSYLSTDTNAGAVNPNNPGNSAVSLGKTGSNLMTIVVTTWIEGWSLLDHGLTGNANGGSNTPIWDPAEYIDKAFNIGIRLGVKGHADDE